MCILCILFLVFNIYVLFVEMLLLFTKPPLLQGSRLTGAGSPNLVDPVEWKVHVEWKVRAEKDFHLYHP